MHGPTKNKEIPEQPRKILWFPKQVNWTNLQLYIFNFKMNFVNCNVIDCNKKCNTCVKLDLHMKKVHQETEKQKIERKQLIVIQEVNKKNVKEKC